MTRETLEMAAEILRVARAGDSVSAARVRQVVSNVSRIVPVPPEVIATIAQLAGNERLALLP